MHRDLYVQMQSKFPECVLIINDLEAFVRETESKMFPTGKLNYTADWFDAYVSGMMALSSCHQSNWHGYNHYSSSIEVCS